MSLITENPPTGELAHTSKAHLQTEQAKESKEYPLMVLHDMPPHASFYSCLSQGK